MGGQFDKMENMKNVIFIIGYSMAQNPQKGRQ